MMRRMVVTVTALAGVLAGAGAPVVAATAVGAHAFGGPSQTRTVAVDPDSVIADHTLPVCLSCW